MPESDVSDTLVFRSPEFAPDDFFLCSVQGHEAISQPYEFRVVLRTAVVLDEDEVQKLLTKPAYVAFGADETDKIHGAVRALEIAPQNDGRGSRVSVTLVPRLWYLSQTRRSRVYLEQTVPEIVRAVLLEAGFSESTDFVMRGSAAHPKREYTVQYQETDLQFVSRLLEHEGMFYFFEHGEDLEKLVVADLNSGFLPVAGHELLPFHPIGGGVDSADSVVEIRHVIQTVPRMAFVRDYNHELPASLLMNERPAPIDEPGWPGDRHGHGFHVADDEHVTDVPQANRVAALRAEEQLARKHQFVGRTTLRALRSGCVFTLSGHDPRGRRSPWPGLPGRTSARVR